MIHVLLLGINHGTMKNYPVQDWLTKNWILLGQLFWTFDVICPEGSKPVYYQHLPTAQLPIRASPSSMGNCNLHMLEESLLYLGDTVYLGWKRFIGYPCLFVFLVVSQFKVQNHFFCSIQRKNECWSPWFAPFRIWSCTIAIGVFLSCAGFKLPCFPAPRASRASRAPRCVVADHVNCDGGLGAVLRLGVHQGWGRQGPGVAGENMEDLTNQKWVSKCLP